MEAMRELARKLLAEGTVQVVIGYEEGRRGVKPVFITDPADAGRLVFNHRCVHNLATYLNPRRSHVARLGKPAVVVKGCDAAAVAALVRESQIKREDIVLIGVRCGGVFRSPEFQGELTADTIAPRCPTCTLRRPKKVDHLIGDPPENPPGVNVLDAQIHELEAKSPAERFAFWTEAFTRCVRCNACRQVCPLCHCDRCISDKTQPQWIESSAHPRGNMAWHMTRAMHMAGRCVGCGECERACPADIPLSLLYRKMSKTVETHFGFVATDDPDIPAPIGTFRKDDQEEFIR